MTRQPPSPSHKEIYNLWETLGHCSQFFKLKKGVWQGNPVTPILFALSIEPLVGLIRGNDQIEGIAYEGGMMHNISLIADYIILFIRNPLSSVPAVIRYLDILSRATYSKYRDILPEGSRAKCLAQGHNLIWQSNNKESNNLLINSPIP